MSEKIGVSSSTFIDLSNPLRDGMNIIGSRLKGDIDAPEIDLAMEVAQKHGIGLELAYRVGIEEYNERLKTISPKVLQIHGPIFSNMTDAFLHGIHERQDTSFISQMKQGVMNPLIGLFAQGTLDRDWKKTRDVAQEFSSSIVLHPRGPLHLKNIGASFEGVVVGIEPDFQRMKESDYIIWRMEDVMDIAEETGTGIIIDISHTAISYNTLDTLPYLYERAKQAPGGVVGIHFNVAIPSKNREDYFTKGTAAMPLRRNTPDYAKGPILEFYKGVHSDPEFTGAFILEFWSFHEDNTPQGRKDAVTETLDVLYGSITPQRSYSIPSKR
jgi:hypothetical protein